MARKDNRIATKTATITLTWPRWAELDRAIKSGKYGATLTSAAEAAIEKHLDLLIETGKIDGLTAAELATTPHPDFVQAKRRALPKKTTTK